MKVLVTGGRGQLGRHLAVHEEMMALGRSELDICDPQSVAAALDRHQPSTVIHAAAMTRVDDCTRNPARAFRVNAGGTEVVAQACAQRSIRLIHISTDYVLDGPDVPGTRLAPDTPPSPQSTYARSKWAAELNVRAFGGHIIRIQWVYSQLGTGFVNRALQMMRTGTSVPLVTDQRGCPTPAPLLASWLAQLCRQPALPPVLHLATRGEATAAEWVCALARAHDIAPVWHPVSRVALTGATRPARSCLDTRESEPFLDCPIPNWRVALRDYCEGQTPQMSESRRAIP